MLQPTRPLPCVGGSARIAHFGGGFESARILAIDEQGRLLEVEGESGDRYEFELHPATAQFLPRGERHGPRLELLG
jgi:hypothetical protein